MYLNKMKTANIYIHPGFCLHSSVAFWLFGSDFYFSDSKSVRTESRMVAEVMELCLGLYIVEALE